jgi:hypothetical protein
MPTESITRETRNNHHSAIAESWPERRSAAAASTSRGGVGWQARAGVGSPASAGKLLTEVAWR